MPQLLRYSQDDLLQLVSQDEEKATKEHPVDNGHVSLLEEEHQDIARNFHSQVFPDHVLEHLRIHGLDVEEQHHLKRMSEAEPLSESDFGQLKRSQNYLESRRCFQVAPTNHCSVDDERGFDVDDVFGVDEVQNVEEDQARKKGEQREVLSRILSSGVDELTKHCSQSHKYHCLPNERNPVAPCVLELDQDLQESVEIGEVGGTR